MLRAILCHKHASARALTHHHTRHAGLANDQGAASCISEAQQNLEDEILQGETVTVEQAANDAIGDGDEEGCEPIVFFVSTVLNSIYNELRSTKWWVILLVLLAGAVAAWAACFVRNRLVVECRGESSSTATLPSSIDPVPTRHPSITIGYPTPLVTPS